MPAVRRSLFCRARVRAGAVVFAAAIAGAGLAAAPDHAVALEKTSTHHSAAHTSHHAHKMTEAQKAAKVLKWASKEKGKPYSYGASGPHSFDCSGLVRYVFQHALHRSLPHYAEGQKQGSHRIWHRRNLKPGDLVFETNGNGYAYHVGIYAGHGMFWHAPHSGTVVKKQHMYHARWRFGRIINH